MAATAVETLGSAEQVTTPVVPASKEVTDYAAKKEAKDGKEKKGFITGLLDDLIDLIDKSNDEKKKQLTALTKTPTRETVVMAFDAANDVTAESQAAYAMRSTNEARAIEMQTAAANRFLALDPLVREGALLVLYVQAEAEYRAAQEAAGYVDRSTLARVA